MGDGARAVERLCKDELRVRRGAAGGDAETEGEDLGRGRYGQGGGSV